MKKPRAPHRKLTELITTEVRRRFVDKISPEPNTGCFLWTGMILATGYGAFSIGSRNDGTYTQALAHRVAWEVFVGPIPDKLHVLHKCDMPICCSVDHLFLGDSRANMVDMASKWRGRRSNSGLPYGVYRTSCATPSTARPFRAGIRRDGKMVYFGVFHTVEEAGAVALAEKSKAISALGGTCQDRELIHLVRGMR